VKIPGIQDPRVLLSNVSGFSKPSTLTALMGSSGAGKTTLLDVLAGRKTTGRILGDVLINGYPKVQETFAHNIVLSRAFLWEVQIAISDEQVTSPQASDSETQRRCRLDSLPALLAFSCSFPLCRSAADSRRFLFSSRTASAFFGDLFARKFAFCGAVMREEKTKKQKLVGVVQAKQMTSSTRAPDF
jgi:ABC-type cobalamin/Fe3+-siderophores transport system ATPase subunit